MVYDVIIVGSGCSGLPAAYNLLSKGFRVAVVEQGDELGDLLPLNQGGEISRFTSLSSCPASVESSSSYDIDTSDSDIDPALFHGVGGSSLIFSAQYPRFHQSDFSTFSTDGVGVDWPIDYKSILPYFQLNDQLTGVAGLLGDPFYPDILGPLLPPVPLGPLGETLKSGFQKLGWHHWPAYAAINTIPYKNRPADNYLRPTNLGDTTGSKGSVDNVYLPLCKSLGLDLFSNTKAFKLQSDDDQIIGLLVINPDRSTQVLKAHKYILCAGALGTPRLLFNSSSSTSSFGLANSSGLVGRNLMLHPLGYAEGYFHQNLSSNYGPQGCCLISQEFYRTDSSRGFARGYTIQSLRGPLPIEAALNLYRRKLLKLGPQFWDHFSLYYNHSAHLTVICEDLPEYTNYIAPDFVNLDSDGMCSLKVTYSLSDNSRKMLSHGVNKSAAYFLSLVPSRLLGMDLFVRQVGILWELV